MIMEYLINFRPYLEVMYFISGITLTVGLALTYKQLSMLKADALNKSQRAAAERAIEAADLFFGKYIPLTDIYYEKREQNKINSYRGPIGDFSKQSLSGKLQTECMKRIDVTDWLAALNCLESIAARFTSGVADESVGFKIFGRSFCGTVEHHYDLIAFSRDQKALGYWSNIVELYKTWHPRLTKVELDMTRQELDAKLSSLTSTSIPPI